MTYENAKSILLTVLIITSCILTGSLWTYQPRLEELEKTDTVQEVSFSAKKNIEEIVQADQLVFHIDNQYYGTYAQKDIQTIMDELKHWDFSSIKKISLEDVSIASLKEPNVVEINYPGSIPFSFFKNFIGIKEKDIPSFSFDQIVINLESNQNDRGIVYFISNEFQYIYSTTVQFSLIEHLNEKYSKLANQYNVYFPVNLDSKGTIYLPENKVELMSYQYLTKYLDSDMFKDALFSDPTLVQKNYIASGEEYRDASSLLRVNLDDNTIVYVDPSGIDTNTKDSNNLIKRSIDYVNGHGGWTDNYRYIKLDREKNSVLFRLYGPDGYPVFSENDEISEIQLDWGKTDISRYMRSNFSFGLLTDTTINELDSGHEAMEKIKKVNNFNPDLLENVKIGYEMKLDGQSLLVQLDPCWFYLYDGTWKKLTNGNMGGKELGLE